MDMLFTCMVFCFTKFIIYFTFVFNTATITTTSTTTNTTISFLFSVYTVLSLIYKISNFSLNLLRFVAITQEFSKNLPKIKGSSYSFGFAIQEFPSEEAV